MLRPWVRCRAPDRSTSVDPVAGLVAGFDNLCQYTALSCDGTVERAMATASLNISLPEALKEFVQERVAEKGVQQPERLRPGVDTRGSEAARRGEARTAPSRRAGIGRTPRLRPRADPARGAKTPRCRKTAGMTKRIVQRPLAQEDIIDQALHIHRTIPPQRGAIPCSGLTVSMLAMLLARSAADRCTLDTMDALKVCACGGCSASTSI